MISNSTENLGREPAQAKHWLEDASKPSEASVKQLIADFDKRKRFVFKQNAPASATPQQMETLARYIEFLKIPNSKVGDKDKERKEAVARLLESSTQFLFCNPEDWACLQQTPAIPMLADHRVDSEANLGKPVKINKALDMQYFFTQQWYKFKKGLLDNAAEVVIPEKASLAAELEKVIDNNWTRVSAAIYGIDGIGEIDSQTKQPNHSMDGVYKAILSQSNMRAVVDVNRYERKTEGSNPVVEYQYPTTEELYTNLNKNSTEASQRVRLEWPVQKIMHNKFFVFEKGANKSVWTGTANISKNCTGDEDFANMAVYIKNNEVSDAFLTEFEEMYEYIPGAQARGPKRVGRFHQNKKPNTKRYFVFNDNTEMNLHFSPTDDGEHRGILPMIFSARAGDVLRVSMFGSGGIEYVRAIQYAAAKGAIVKVLLDRDTTFQVSNSWMSEKAATKLTDANPYGPVKGRIEVRYNMWGGGHMNHHKSATLTRKTPKGLQGQVIVIGSQNWSVAGNDENDENMIMIRNLKSELPIIKAYNEHFDTMLWPSSVVPKK